MKSGSHQADTRKHQKVKIKPIVIFNKILIDTHLIIDNTGIIKAVYRKTHLFDTALGGNNTMNESATIERGKEIVPPVETPIGKLGLSIVQ